jgi:putative tricarboxylic transport membrane protein
MPIDALLHGMATLMRPDMLLTLFVGSIVGLTFGLLPGLSAITGMALVLPFTFGMDPLAAMLIYAGIISVSPLGGSLPAILLNTPGTPQNLVSCFDGYPMAKRGEGSRAIAVTSMSCLVGTIIGVVILLALLPFVKMILLKFRAPEIFWVIIFGLIALSGISRQGSLKGLASGGFGLLIASVGWNDVFAGTRFTGGSLYLWDGIPLIPFFVGLLAVSELMAMSARGGQIASNVSIDIEVKGKARQTWEGILDVILRPGLVARSSLIGTFVGIVPGAGGAVASLMSYAAAKRISRTGNTYGTGNVEGLIASEVSNDAKEGGALLPTVAFGIPGSPEMAIVLGAFVMHGLQPGPLLLNEHMDVVVMLVLGVMASQVVASALVLLGATYIAHLTQIRVKLLIPVILTLCFAGTFSIRENPWDIIATLGAGFLGLYMKRFGYPLMPLAIAFVLGELLERTFHQSLMMNFGNYSVFVSSPISVTLIVCSLAVLAWSGAGWLKGRRSAQAETAAELAAERELMD